MTQPMLCGDEVRAAVIDIGDSFSRFGTAGQDLPRHVFKTNVGISNFSANICIGDPSLRCVRAGLDIKRPLEDETNWDSIEAIFQYGLLDNGMKIDSSEHPLMLCEGIFNTNKKKQQLLEILYEKFFTPAAFFMPNSSLSSFSAGRQNSLVIDIGSTSTRITPVVEGYSMKKSTITTYKAGNWMDLVVRQEIDKKLLSNGKVIRPWYELDERYNKIEVSPSYRDYHIRDIVRDVKQWMCFVPYVPLQVDLRSDYYNNKVNLPAYELPDGSVISHSDNLCSVPEKLFISTNYNHNKSNKKIKLTPILGIPSHLQPFEINSDSDSLQELVYSSIGKCDVDIRKELLSNILVVGGGAAIDGMSQRLIYELNEILTTSYKAKSVSQLNIEKSNSAWIGGSILSICGTFQQMWLSKSEYEEYGSSIIESRFVC